MYSIGFDVALRQIDIALINWTTNNVTFSMININTAINNIHRIVANANGIVNNIAQQTQIIPQQIQQSLIQFISQVRINKSCRIFIGIDCPSGLSRRLNWHGRATELFLNHVLQRPHRINPQWTPSIAVQRIHISPWQWIFNGMALYYLFANNYQYDPQSWQNYLQNGFVSNNVIEVFPRATINFVRQNNAMQNFSRVLNTLNNVSNVVNIINNSLGTGNPTRNHRADALIAALTTLGFFHPLFSLFFVRGNFINYQPNPPNWQAEGIITLLR
ncbi:MAG: hypothetical protein NTW26_07535 [bacterium]|nr:hypothetical protein [bacterium]